MPQSFVPLVRPSYGPCAVALPVHRSSVRRPLARGLRKPAWPRLAPLALVLLAIGAPSMVAQDDPPPVVENWPDGTVRLRYEVDDQGRKDGLLQEYREDGSLMVEAEYREDQRWGKYESFHPGGEKWVVASYVRGEKNGAWREYEADGRKVEISQWRAGQLHGRFESYHEDGERHRIDEYREGLRHGKCREFRDEGEWEKAASYEKGVLDGEVKITLDRKVISKQKWKDGLLLNLDGLTPFPVARAELAQGLEAILAEPSPAPQDEADPLLPERAAALRLLQAYRRLCRVPYEDMALNPEWFPLVDAASEVCRANGGLSHDPPQPAGMDEERYRQGHLGASRSNLAMGSGVIGSVDSYMDDSDPSNIDRVGHRRWCLNPNMRRTAFGGAGRYSAMWSMDSSGPGARGLESVMYPPAGFVPVDFFGTRHAWSVATLRGGRMKVEDTKIEIVELDEDYLPDGGPLEIDYLGVAGGGYGTGPCLIFRPVGLRVYEDARFRCRISLDGGKRWAYDYVVEFIAPIRGGGTR